MPTRLFIPLLLPLVMTACSADSGAKDSGTSDGGTNDGGSSDGGTNDGGSGDGGTTDGGSSDGGTTDGGSSSTACSGGSGWTAGGALFEVDGLSAWRYVPESVAKGSTPCAPVLTWAHGGSSFGRIVDGAWVDNAGTNFEELAELHGFVLIVPGAEKGTSTHSWSLDLTDELAALSLLAADNVDIDLDRVWLTGVSSGGHMVTYTGLYDPGPFTAIASVACGLGGYFDYPTTEPDPKLPWYVGHDPDDAVVPYKASVYLVEQLDLHGHDYVFVKHEVPGNAHGWTQPISAMIIEFFQTH